MWSERRFFDAAQSIHIACLLFSTGSLTGSGRSSSTGPRTRCSGSQRWKGADLALQDREEQEEDVVINVPRPDGSINLDGGGDIHIPNNLCMVPHTRCDVDLTKVIEESGAKCGFEACRLLSKAFDPYNVDADLLERATCCGSRHVPPRASSRRSRS